MFFEESNVENSTREFGGFLSDFSCFLLLVANCRAVFDIIDCIISELVGNVFDMDLSIYSNMLSTNSTNIYNNFGFCWFRC